MLKIALIAAAFTFAASAANANELTDNFHGNTQRWSMSQNARSAFAAQPVAVRTDRMAWQKMTPFSREDLDRAAQ